MSRIRKFIAFPPGQRQLLVRAWLLSGYYRVALARKPLRSLLTSDGALSASPALSAGQLARAGIIGRIAAMAASAPPWRGRCLLQALVAQHLLRDGGIPGELVLGVDRAPGAGPGSGALAAHAWLCVGAEVICGAQGHEAFTILARYPWRGRGQDRAGASAPTSQ